MRFGQNLFASSAQVALNAGADVLTIRPGIPILPVRYGYVVEVELDNTQALILSLDYDPLGAGARVELATLTGAGTDAIGTVHYRDLGADEAVRVYPGYTLVVEVKQAGTAGDGYVWVEYTPLSWADTAQAATLQTPIEYTS
jgi:hypothetical protein